MDILCIASATWYIQNLIIVSWIQYMYTVLTYLQLLHILKVEVEYVVVVTFTTIHVGRIVALYVAFHSCSSCLLLFMLTAAQSRKLCGN